ncbi:MAG: multicopper oxidase domain-containing protein, partial [Actinomycetota bacterium]|nr:multicopper oxidase domain-containing protein [Actinomycetota bacterium]
TDYYRMSMQATPIEIVPGYQTLFFAYDGAVPGPTIKVDQGRIVKVRHCNTLPSTHPTLGYVPYTSVHLHGSASLPQFDGYASDITQPGRFKDYIYPNYQPARTLWYHDHAVHHTAENAYFGCAAQYQLRDELEQSLPIPHGRYDIPLILSDALFNNDGSLLFTLEDENGLWGDVILVNGHPWPVMQVERRKYRFRILGTAISRSWKLSLDSGEPMAVIATDGGLMPTPQYVKSFRTTSSERYEVIIDFAKYPIGRRVILKNSSPKNNRNYANTDKIMAFDVVGEPTGDLWDNTIPDVLNPNDPTMALQPANAVRTRKFLFHRTNGQWKINSKSWKDVEGSGFQFTLANPKRGDIEIWEFDNPSGGWFHPIHVHLVDFKILDRNGQPPPPHELGPKDVVYLGENEKVRVIAKFDREDPSLPYGGKYMIHCHNLIHEDHDMMGQYEVTDPAATSDDPLGTPAISLSEEAAHPL